MAKRKGKAADLAAMSFEQVPAEILAELLRSITNERLNHLVIIRLAFVGLSKSKEELKGIARKSLADNEFNPIEGFENSIGFLSSGVEFLTAAKMRRLVAGAAVIAEEEARSC
jgi:hypothetical protein